MSPTIILNGCMAMLMLVSSSMSMMRPNIMTCDMARPSEPALGSRHITATATRAPTNR